MPVSKASKVLEKYFRHMVKIRNAPGTTEEMSNRSAIEDLMNGLGQIMSPAVVCNGELKNKGAGRPDFGLFSEKQCADLSPDIDGFERPDYGVGEVKPLSSNMEEISKRSQIKNYLAEYDSVLVTNFRQFRFIRNVPHKDRKQTDDFELAASEEGFWQLAEKPAASGKQYGDDLEEFFSLSVTPVTIQKPEDLAARLARHAQKALRTIKGEEAEVPPVLQNALHEATGVEFKNTKDNHFLESTLVQTLFYGIFSAWVVWQKSGCKKEFSWQQAGDYLKVPAIRILFEEIAKTSSLEKLRISPILERADNDFGYIDGEVFLSNLNDEEVIQHFYEPFLQKFDPKLKEEMGVWYTPPEIVKYMVARVDKVLEDELGVEGGLANEQVYVLDPCCGTGAFVLEVLKKIEERLTAKNADAFIGADIKKAALKRVFGFEILPAPFVIAHWQVANLLAKHGKGQSPLREGERPAIYLTNALKGWEEDSGEEQAPPLFPELLKEREDADKIKRDKRILVVIGNPPYNAFAAVKAGEDPNLVDAYREGLKKWGFTRTSLEDLYVRFFRIAEKRIEKTGKGIVSYISNYSWTTEPSFVVMRQKILRTFDKLWIDNLHGNRKRNERAPDGSTSQTIFHIPGYSPGITQGVVVSLAAKKGGGGQQAKVLYRDDINDARAADRRKALLASLKDPDFNSKYEVAKPEEANKFVLRPLGIEDRYLGWPKLDELAKITPLNGMMEKRSGGLINIDKDTLERRMQAYFDPTVSWESLKEINPGLTARKSHYDPEKTRKKALRRAEYNPANLIDYLFLPFDVRNAYYTNIIPIWNSHRPNLWAQRSEPNKFLISRSSNVVEKEGLPLFFACCIGDNAAQRGNARYLPFRDVSGKGDITLGEGPNLSNRARGYLESIGKDPTASRDADDLFYHVLAIACSPLYLAENKDGVENDWVRVPLPADRDSLSRSAELGKRVAALFNTLEAPGGKTKDLLDALARIGTISSSELEIDFDLGVHANWGHRRKGRVMPAKGKTRAASWTEEQKKILEKAFHQAGVSSARGFELLGEARDIYLNDTTYWCGVPEKVWQFHVGGHQILKKWLSYRAMRVLERDLQVDEARAFTNIAMRILVLILLQDDLDSSYQNVASNAYAWPPVDEEQI